MNGNKLILDTNIILYLLSGDKTVFEIINGKELYISFITELELLGFKGIETKELQIIKDFLAECKIIDLNSEIKVRVIDLKRSSSIRLPDAIIIATSQYLNIPLISADKEFNKVENLDLICYQR